MPASLLPDTSSAESELPTLEPRHLIWILEAAQESFADRITKYELDIIRCERFINEPLCGKSMEEDDRSKKIESLQRFLEQYRSIVRFLQVARKKVADHQSKEFAAEIGAWLRSQGV